MDDNSLCTKEFITETVHTYGDGIIRLAFSYMKNQADAEDILQDTMLALLKSNKSFENAQHQKAWLLRVAINLCKNRLRCAWFQSVLPLSNAQDVSVDLTHDESNLLTVIAKLPLKYREVIHLFYYEDYSCKTIATLLQKKESTVRSLLSRGRLLLKEKLQGDYNDEEYL